MKKKSFTSFCLMLLVFLNSCQDDGHNGILVHLDSFPLTIGNSWKYNTVVDVDTIGGHYIDKNYDSYLFVDSDTIINTILSSKIVQIDSNSSGTVRISSRYYANQINGFYGTAADFNSSQILLKNTNSKYLFQDAMMCTFGNYEKGIDSVFIPQSPLYLMKFPVVIGESWNSLEYDQSANVIRKWTGFSNVVTSAGTFACVKMQIFFDTDHNGLPDANNPVMYQYYSAKGLIQEIQMGDLIFQNGSSFNFVRTSKLIQVNF